MVFKFLATVLSFCCIIGCGKLVFDSVAYLSPEDEIVEEIADAAVFIDPFANQEEPPTDGDGGVIPSGPVCGNGIIEVGEACDIDDLNGASCALIGQVGELSCDATCLLDWSNCEPPEPDPDPDPDPDPVPDGDGGFVVVDPPPEGEDGGQTIVTPPPEPECGDGIIEAPEVCDGPVTTLTCEIIAGLNATGEVLCNETCDGFDTSGCQAAVIVNCEPLQGSDVDAFLESSGLFTFMSTDASSCELCHGRASLGNYGYDVDTVTNFRNSVLTKTSTLDMLLHYNNGAQTLNYSETEMAYRANMNTALPINHTQFVDFSVPDENEATTEEDELTEMGQALKTFIDMYLNPDDYEICDD